MTKEKLLEIARELADWENQYCISQIGSTFCNSREDMIERSAHLKIIESSYYKARRKYLEAFDEYWKTQQPEG